MLGEFSLFNAIQVPLEQWHLVIALTYQLVPLLLSTLLIKSFKLKDITTHVVFVYTS